MNLEDLMYLTVGFIIGGIVVSFNDYNKYNAIPKTEQVQQGYVAPNKIKIECKNWDTTDSLPETYMKIGGKSYILREDSLGKPIISDYEIIPGRVIPKE